MSRLCAQGHKLSSVCDFAGISRQAFHKRLGYQNRKHELYNTVEELVVNNRRRRSRVGVRTIYHKENMSSLLGINQVEREMSACGFALKPYKSFMKTTDSRGHYNKFNNLIMGLELTNENQVLVGDITYYRNNTGLYYIFHFVDYYTLEVKGLIGSTNMEGINAEKCLRQVFKYNGKRKYNNLMIVHTDGGVQYRSNKFQKMIRDAQIRPSQAKSCFENGLSERENGIVKNEYLIDYDIKNATHLNRVLKKVKHEINEVWPSKTLGYRTPKQYAKLVRELDEKDRPVKKVKIVQ